MTHLHLTADEQERFAAEMEADKEVNEMVVTWEEAIAEREAKAHTESRAVGRAEGEASGKVQMLQAVLLNLAQKRGLSSPDLEHKIRAIVDLDRLNRILDHLVEAESLDGVDLDPQSSMP